ncbi:MAG: SDR family oxidoreductase [Deltaproteobacteria bacterium]|nr:SDR family oxidoreductase [Deltaproteobacteria bacterium]
MSSTVEAQFSLSGKVAIVTGALGLLGKEHCHALAGAGATLVAVDLDGPGCQAFATELGRTYDRPCLGVGVNITSPEELTALRDQVLARFGRIDVLVNNAAVNDSFENPSLAAEQSRFEKYPLEKFRAALDVNVTGTHLCCQLLGTPMAERGEGSIINVASTYGLVAPDQSIYRRPDGSQAFHKSPVYSVTKGAVIMLTKFLAAYWGEKGVRVNTLSPGGVENGQDAFFVQNYARKTPLGRMAQPGDYRGALVFLASDASAYMTGANLVVDGGWTCW